VFLPCSAHQPFRKLIIEELNWWENVHLSLFCHHWISIIKKRLVILLITVKFVQIFLILEKTLLFVVICSFYYYFYLKNSIVKIVGTISEHYYWKRNHNEIQIISFFTKLRVKIYIMCYNNKSLKCNLNHSRDCTLTYI
jgi:hypothetical protein